MSYDGSSLKLVSRGVFCLMERGEKKEDQRKKPMGRSPSFSNSKEGINRGAWSAEEDKMLVDYITAHGEGRWRSVPKKAGLNRCGRSCRLRWLNYLRPNIKRGNISADEDDLIIRLHRLLGNRWSLIAGRLPGRTDNEIKNYWNTKLSKKFQQVPCAPSIPRNVSKPIDQKNPSENVRDNPTGKSKVLSPPESDNVEVTAPVEGHHEGTGQNDGCPPLENHREDGDGTKSDKEFMDAVSGEQSYRLPDALDSQLRLDKQDEDRKNDGCPRVGCDDVGGCVSATVKETVPFEWGAGTTGFAWDEQFAGLGADSDMTIFLDNGYGYGYWDNLLGWN